MKCEICSVGSTVHVTEVQSDGTSLERHLCDAHAREAGIVLPSAEQSPIALVPKLRSLSKFIRANNRMPTPEEMAQFGAFGDLTQTLSGTSDFDRHVTYLEDLATFIEQHGRYPTEQEMPDPF